jgi:HlyD family secretion protein
MKRKTILLICIFLVVGLATVFIISRFFLPTTLDEGEFETAIVNRGTVIESIAAEGVVEPGSEVLILSPASSIITRIVREAGSHVKAGQAILVLDPEPIEAEIERIQDQLQVKQNNLRKNRLNARSTKVDLDYNVEVKNLAIASLKSELVDQEQLLEVGGISPARFEKTKQELALADKDLEMILEKNSIRLKQLETEEEGLLLQIQIQEKELADKMELLDQMIVRAPSSGIVLSVSAKEGEKVNTDRLLVTMSDLTTFKIKASINDEYSGSVKTGKEVIILVDHEMLSGKIGNIHPVIMDNKLVFDVFLEQSNHEKLISNLKVDLLVVNARKDSVLRIQNGPAFNKGEKQEVFAIANQIAMRQEIITGLIGDGYMEIISGVEEGDRIIISDISSFRHMKEVEIEGN